MNTLNRYIVWALVVKYVVALGVMICLYVVLDLFVNIDEFTEHGHSLWTTVGEIADYYGPNVLVYFAQLSGVITLFACMATIARMRRLNELTALLASGVGLHRVASPIICFGVATSMLHFVDTEMLIPQVAHLLSRDHDDVGGRQTYEVLFLPDGDNVLVSAANFDPKTATMRGVLILELDAEGAMLCSVRADRATWSPTPGGATKGRWLLERFGVEYPDPQRRGESKTGPAVFLTGMYASDLSPEDVQRRQTESWVRSLSLSQLKALQDDLTQRSREPGASASALLEVVRTKHERIAAPLVSLVMLMLGLPFFLDRTPGNILGDALRCMIATGLCYTLAFVAKSIDPGTVSPLPFWLPVFVFAPIATVLITRIRT